MEGRFNVASNAARSKPNCRTQTLSRVVRDHSNGKATEYVPYYHLLHII